MHYTELLAGVNAYARAEKIRIEKFPEELYEPETKYFKALDDSKPFSERAKFIVNGWGSRVHIDSTKLQREYEVFQRDYRAVTGWNLAGLSLWDHHDIIVKIFSKFADIVKYTGASKVLHILNPQFFMMWDVAIRHKYGCFDNGEGYFNFLYRSLREIQEVLQTYTNEHGTTIEISQRIYSGQTKTVVKLLDEYNWAKYKKEWI